jgi:peroxiredoxin
VSGNQVQASGEGGLSPGKKAPSFTATDYEGRVVRLDDFQGQRRILAFILPGCSSCTGTMSALNSFVQSEDVTKVFVIGGSDRELNHAYALEHETHLTVLTPTRDFHAGLYQIQGVPFVFVIDEAGIIRAKGVVNEDEQLQRLLAGAFALTSVSQ